MGRGGRKCHPAAAPGQVYEGLNAGVDGCVDEGVDEGVNVGVNEV